MEKINQINRQLQLHTIVYDDLDSTPKLLPHFLRHYSNIGVTEFIIGVVIYEGFSTDIFDLVSSYCKNYNVKLIGFTKNIYKSEKELIEKHLKDKYYVNKDEYIIYADIDEFFEYPAPMSEILEQMDKKNIWCISSNFCDRISLDGSLKDIDPEIDIGLQFPLGTTLTQNILKTITQKVILQRGRVILKNAGHHDTLVGKLDRWPIGDKSQYSVNHFKWNGSLLNRIKHRLEHRFSHMWYSQEQVRFLNFFQENNNIIPIDNKLLNTKYLGKLRYFT